MRSAVRASSLLGSHALNKRNESTSEGGTRFGTFLERTKSVHLAWKRGAGRGFVRHRNSSGAEPVNLVPKL